MARTTETAQAGAEREERMREKIGVRYSRELETSPGDILVPCPRAGLGTFGSLLLSCPAHFIEPPCLNQTERKDGSAAARRALVHIHDMTAGGATTIQTLSTPANCGSPGGSGGREAG